MRRSWSPPAIQIRSAWETASTAALSGSARSRRVMSSAPISPSPDVLGSGVGAGSRPGRSRRPWPSSRRPGRGCVSCGRLAGPAPAVDDKFPFGGREGRGGPRPPVHSAPRAGAERAGPDRDHRCLLQPVAMSIQPSISSISFYRLRRGSGGCRFVASEKNSSRFGPCHPISAAMPLPPSAQRRAAVTACPGSTSKPRSDRIISSARPGPKSHPARPYNPYGRSGQSYLEAVLAADGRDAEAARTGRFGSANP